jgi:hypothetical protein
VLPGQELLGGRTEDPELDRMLTEVEEQLRSRTPPGEKEAARRCKGTTGIEGSGDP